MAKDMIEYMEIVNKVIKETLTDEVVTQSISDMMTFGTSAITMEVDGDGVVAKNKDITDG